MTDITTIVNGYIAAWNEPDADRRRELVADTFDADATYLDPLMSGEGTDGIAAMIGRAQQQFPGHRFELSAGPDAHNDRVRFAWTLLSVENGTPAGAGVDFAIVADDGRLREVTGFLEQPVAG
jgi:hypothetical protein